MAIPSEFPLEMFTISGDPIAIARSSKDWTEFADNCTTAASQIRGLNTEQFIGPEADIYRQHVGQELPSHLDNVSAGYHPVGEALLRFSRTLQDFQDAMAPLKIHGQNCWEHLISVKIGFGYPMPIQQGEPLLGGPPPPLLPIQAEQAADIAAAQHAWDTVCSEAAALKASAADAAAQCAAAIRQAKSPHFAERPSGAQGAIFDHSEGLSQLSSLLSALGLGAAAICVIPIIGEGAAPVAGPVAIGAGGASLGIESGLAWAGVDSATNVMIGAAAMFVPGGKLAKWFTRGRAVRLGESSAKSVSSPEAARSATGLGLETSGSEVAPKFPTDLIPPGGRASDVGSGIWGRGLDEARIALERPSIGISESGLDREGLRRLLKLYEWAEVERPNNKTAPIRAALLRRILDTETGR